MEKTPVQNNIKMDDHRNGWKEFFRPTIIKVVSDILLLLFLPMIPYPYLMVDGPSAFSFKSFIGFFNESYMLKSLKPINIVISLIISYILVCFIVSVYKAIIKRFSQNKEIAIK